MKILPESRGVSGEWRQARTDYILVLIRIKYGSRNYLKDSSTLQHTAIFYSLAHLSGKLDWIFHENFIIDVYLDKKVHI